MLSPDKLQIFLDTIREKGSIGAACKKITCAASLIEEMRQADPDFDRALNNALEEYRSLIEEEIHRRGITGYEEEVYQGGVLVGTKRKFSDRLLEIHAKRHIAAYRDTVDVNAEFRSGVIVLGGTEGTNEWLKKFGGTAPQGHRETTNNDVDESDDE